ncbi:Importin-13 [Nymphon striatum]|nr:Importin-13 [Nymphon striatum]
MYIFSIINLFYYLFFTLCDLNLEFSHYEFCPKKYFIKRYRMAIDQFYNDSSSQEQVHQWLTEVQKSPEAWNFAWDLLNPSKAIEVQFFGASTLHMKISRFWRQLPPEHYEPLKQKLLEWIINYTSGPKLIINRLCIAISSFIVHTINDYWPNAVQDICFLPLKEISNVSPEALAKVSLEILTFLPEEVCMLDQLKRIFENLHSEPDEIRFLAIRCLNSWIQFIGCLNDVESFLPHLFKAVSDEEISEMSLEALANIVLHPEACKYSSLLSKFICFSTEFELILQKAMEDNDIDLCNSIYGVVIALIETHTDTLFEEFCSNFEKRQMTLKLIHMLLKCTGSHGQYPTDETYSEASLCVWYTIQDEVMAAVPEKRDQFLFHLVPIYRSLVDLLLVKVCYPTDHIYDTWNSELKNHFRCYRQDIADTFSYCYNILKSNMFNILSSNITVLLQTSQDPQWQQLEACLFAFQSIAVNAGCQEDRFLPTYFRNIVNIPLKNSKVASTLFDSIGAYSEWISYHIDHCEIIIPLLLHHINDVAIAPSATLCLKEICRECGSSLIHYFEAILSAIQVSLKSSIIGMNEQVRLVGTLGSVLSEMPASSVYPYLNALVLPYIHKIEKLAAEQYNNLGELSIIFKDISVLLNNNNFFLLKPSAYIKPNILLSMNVISMLFLTLKVGYSEENAKVPSMDENPNFQLMLQFLPTLFKVGLLWYQDPDVLDRSSSSLNSSFGPILPDTLSLILGIHQKLPDQKLIDLSKQILKKKKTVVFEAALPIQHLFHLAVSALALPEDLTVKAASQFLMIGGESTRTMIDYIPDIILALNQKYFDNLCHWINILNSNENLPVPTVTKEQKLMYTRNILKEKKNRRILVGILKEYTLLCRGLIGTEYGRQTCL